MQLRVKQPKELDFTVNVEGAVNTNTLKDLISEQS